ncbi:phage terminase large subunit [Actinacidiphila sp. ITFR-21]|uniref:phage terminase large subunit n=1 Tax=Actinacidiphila sp. ITFR-21 TaxID=3075199 RepID=UPI00288B2758|nr:phage terminase large subunit [Streptomyces sp. ITFR-21]WNI19162.1 phage terminase large subunit [Streptomyces sp. ITFR-21]
MTTAVAPDTLHHYEPWGSALELMECRLPQVLLSGPAGTGKSRACLEKLHLMALANPGMRGLIVRKTRESLGSTALVTWREHVAKEALATGIMSFYGGSAEEPPQYRYANGSKVMIGGMDKPTKIMSSEYDVAYVQEAIELTTTDWENITTRLRNGKVSFQQLIADANPDMPSHWLKQHCDRGTARMVHCRHEDNPVLFNADGTMTVKGEAYMKLLDALTGVRKQRLRHGLWVSAEGVIYENFDPAIHLVDKFPIPDTWTRWWSVDFGYTNPFVLQCWAEDPDGRLYLYREIYKTKTLVEDHAKRILREVTACTVCCNSTAGSHDCYECDQCAKTWTEPRPRAIICDHDAEDRATLERHLGMSTAPAHKSVSDGIQAVNARYKAAGDGRARLFIFRGAVVERDEALDAAKKPCSTEEEIPGYVWDRGTTSQQLADKPPKEVPVKINDHGCDAKRYMVAEVDIGGRPRIRVM